MKALVLSLPLLLLSISLFSQKATLSGYVNDAGNGETLIGVTIYVQETGAGTNTNEYGFYSLSLPVGTYTIGFSYVGFEDKAETVNLQSDRTLTIEMGEDAVALEEIVVKSEADDGNITSAEMSTAKLSTNTIKKIPAVLGEVDLVKAVQLLPGVTNNGEGASGFNVRGGAEDQNLILMDEAIIYNSAHLLGFFSVFNADAMKGVKLYKGGIPSQFGGRVSSVLDIRQKDGNKKRFGMTGGIGAVSSRLMLEGPYAKGKGSFLLAGRGSYVHLFLKLAKNENSAYFYDVNGKISYTINDRNRLYLSGYAGNDVFDISNSFGSGYGNYTANLRWNHVFSKKLFSNLSVIYSKYNYGLELNELQFSWGSDISNYNLKYDFAYYVNDELKVDFGASAIYYDLNPGTLRPTSEASPVNPRQLESKHALENGIYLSVEQRVGGKLTFQYGLRHSHFISLGRDETNVYANDRPLAYNDLLGIYERVEPTHTERYGKGKAIRTFHYLEPRAAISYQMSENTSLKASYNRMVQYMHLISNTSSATPLDVWTPSGKFFDPQIGNQYAVGFFKNLRDNEFTIEVESYYKIVRNRLDYIDGAQLIANDAIEREAMAGKMQSFGLEFLFRRNSGTLTGWVAYTLARAEQRTAGGNAGGPGLNQGEWYKASHDRTHDLSLTMAYDINKKWSVSSNFIFQTGRPVTFPNSQFDYQGITVANYSGRNTNRLTPYHRLDFAATMKLGLNQPDKRFQNDLMFSIYNLYNRRNAASITFGQDTKTGANQATRIAIFGIVPSVTWNFRF